ARVAQGASRRGERAGVRRVHRRDAAADRRAAADVRGCAAADQRCGPREAGALRPSGPRGRGVAARRTWVTTRKLSSEIGSKWFAAYLTPSVAFSARDNRLRTTTPGRGRRPTLEGGGPRDQQQVPEAGSDAELRRVRIWPGLPR